MTSAPAADGRLRRVLRRLRRQPSSLVAGAVILAFIIVALAAPWVAPQDPLASSFLAVRKPPTVAHWLGTDEVGRDVFSRLVWGARTSMLAGLIPVLVALSISLPLGLLSGYAGGWIDMVVQRVASASPSA